MVLLAISKGTLRVRIHDDEVAESNGQIQVTLLADNASPATYRIEMDGTETAMADIIDDESFPVITISGGPKIIESDVEGSPAGGNVYCTLKGNT